MREKMKQLSLGSTGDMRLEPCVSAGPRRIKIVFPLFLADVKQLLVKVKVIFEVVELERAPPGPLQTHLNAHYALACLPVAVSNDLSYREEV